MRTRRRPPEVPGRPLRVALGGGRVIGGLEVGDPAGRPVLYFHGTPGSSAEALALDEVAAQAGVRLVALDRPGIGDSTPRPGRRVREWAADAADAAERLGLHTPAVLGYSGGGPYALACAVADPADAARFGPVGVVSGPQPVRSKADLALMDPTDRVLTVLGRRAPAVGGLVVGLAGRWVRTFPGLSLRLWMGGLPRTDRAVLVGPGGPGTATMVQLGWVMARSGRGVVDDERALADPWGFAAADVSAPVLWWYGDADTVVPWRGVEPFVASLPSVSVTRVERAGHLLLGRVASEVFAALR